MGHMYKTVSWNRQKRVYDAVLWFGIVTYLGVFLGLGAALYPNATLETLILRGTSTCAFILLHIILSLGPLSRLNDRFLPFLYNRRHMGVSMFIVALVHAAFATVQFHTLGDLNPFVSIFVSGTAGGISSGVPFQAFGALALIILFMMAATSHDFWLTQLTAPIWKRLHMAVYIAYALLIAHVAFGIIQDTQSGIPMVLLSLGALWIVGIHLWAGRRESKTDTEQPVRNGFVNIGNLESFLDKSSHIVTISGERVALFNYNGRLSALSNVCQHQNGPLGEGEIIDGYVTCPWHGYQYCPLKGVSPAPFTEAVPTFDVKIEAGDVWISATPNPLGTESRWALVEGPVDSGSA